MFKDFVFRNNYRTSNDVVLENFSYENLFDKVEGIDHILQIVRAMLLEKHVILIKDDLSDMAIIM